MGRDGTSPGGLFKGRPGVNHGYDLYLTSAVPVWVFFFLFFFFFGGTRLVLELNSGAGFFEFFLAPLFLGLLVYYMQAPLHAGCVSVLLSASVT